MKPTETKIMLDDEDMGTLCICALRYCMGRETYMPSLVIGICTGLLPTFDDRDLYVMLRDCEFVFESRRWGDDYIDRPTWEQWVERLKEEMARREDNKSEGNG